MGKESTCNAGDAGDVSLIPGSARSPGGGHGNPHQYSCLENPWTKESPYGHKELDTTEATEHAGMHTYTKPWTEEREPRVRGLCVKPLVGPKETRKSFGQHRKSWDKEKEFEQMLYFEWEILRCQMLLCHLSFSQDKK